jgi:hypothetical protein
METGKNTENFDLIIRDANPDLKAGILRKKNLTLFFLLV